VTGTIAAQITTTVQGTLPLAQRPGDAFKPVMLSSMHISRAHWDTQAALAGGRTFPIPEQGWIVPSPVAAARFGLQGGRSSWQAHAPTIEVVLQRPLPITGWVTASHDPNDDNVGWWAAADQVVPAWSYTVRATRCVPDGAGHIEAAGVRWSRP
jgi:hypothetical protein